MRTKLKIRAPDDFHVHFRSDKNTQAYVEAHASQFARALVMPNTRPEPIICGRDAQRYREWMLSLLPSRGPKLFFDPLMTIQIRENTSPAAIHDAKRVGVVAGKLYPEGVTTNSNNGVRDLEKLDEVFQTMALVGMNLCIHAEKPGSFILDRERDYGMEIYALARKYPTLRITIEHVTDRRTLNLVHQLPNVAASITAHHLELTLDDVIGDGIRPHNYCKPIAKRELDRAALQDAAMGGHPRFFLGSDSAPHSIKSKECDCGAAGVFTAPILMPLLATRFEKHDMLHRLEAFTSENGAKWYGLPLNGGKLTLKRKVWEVPEFFSGAEHDVRLFMAGEKLTWRVEEADF